MGRTLVPFVFALVILVLSGCSDSETSTNDNEPGADVLDTAGEGPDGSSVDKEVDPGALAIETEAAEGVVMGEPLQVTCTVTSGGAAVDTETTIEVTGTEAYTIEGDLVYFDETGSFEVACTAPAYELVDDSPATVVVSAAPAASVETTVDLNEVPVGDKVSVTCTVLDADGNDTGKSAVFTVDPADVGTTSSTFFYSKVVGTFTITCGLADGSLDDETPETVVVVAGELKKVVAELGTDSIPAGGSTSAACVGYDKFGNVVEGAPIDVIVPEAVTFDGTSVTSTVAGVYEITCEPTDGSSPSIQTANLTVEPLDAVGIALSLSPNKPSYKIGDQVTVGFSQVDTYGNQIPGGEIEEVWVEPTIGIMPMGSNKFKFDAEGMYTFSSCLVGAPEICDDVDGWCDGTGPMVVIDYPPRGATLDGDATVTVTGTVNEMTSTLESLTINDTEVTPNDDGTFSFPIQAVQGMNLINLAATDSFGNVTTNIQSYHFSTTYYPVDTATPQTALVPQAAKAFLDDSFFYSDDPDDTANLSYLLSLVLADIDIASMIPNPAAVDQDLSVLCLFDNYDIYIENVSYGDPVVKLTPVFSGLHLFVSIPDFHANARLEEDHWACSSIDLEITAGSIALHADINIYLTDDTGELVIDVVNPDVSFIDLDINVENWYGFLVNWILDLFSGTITDAIMGEFESMITDMVADAVSGITDLIGEPFDIPIDSLFPGMNPVVLKLVVDLSKIEFSPEGGDIDVDLAVVADKFIDPTPLGAIGRASCLAPDPEVFAFTPGATEKIELAAHDDLINELLFSFWYNGGLNLHIDADALAELGADLSQYGLGDLTLDTAPLSQPVLTHCNADEQTTAQIGDFYGEAKFTFMDKPVDLRFYLFLELGVDLMLVDGEDGGKEIGIAINEPNFVEMHIEYLNEEWAGQESLFIGLVKDTLIPIVLSQVGEEPISFAIPAINLADLAGSSSGGEAPDLTLPDKDLVLDLKDLSRILGYFLIKSDIQIVDPPVEEPVEEPAP